MERLHFENVNLLLIDPAASARDTLKNILHDQGFRNLAMGTSLNEIQDHLSNFMPDLLISDTELADGDFCKFVTKLRHHDVGSNPFMPVIGLTWEPTPDLVKGVVNAGVDDLLTKPISTNQLVGRIKALVNGRKPFVVTSEYIGPDRRPSNGRTSDIPQVDVPNTLKVKATGQQDSFDVVEAINSVVAEINVQKLERYGVQIGFLIDHILPNLEKGVFDSTTEAFLDRLLAVAEDTARRLGGTKYAHISELCDSLVKITQSILAAREQLNARDVKLLRPLSQAIQASFAADDERTAAAARQIFTQIDTIESKPAAESKPAEPPREQMPTSEAAAPPREVEPAPEAAAPPPVPKPAPDASAGDIPADDGRSPFERAFAQHLCAFIRARLDPFIVAATGSAPLPFILSAEFADRFERAVGEHLVPTLIGNRRIQMLAQSISEDSLNAETFFKVFELPPKENVVRNLWDDRWGAVMETLRSDREAAKAAKGGDKKKGGLLGRLGRGKEEAPAAHATDRNAEQARALWAVVQDGGGAYDPPKLSDISLFKALFDYEPDEVRGGINTVVQLLTQESTKDGGGRQGSSRQHMCELMRIMPSYCGELIALWAYMSRRKHFTPSILKSFIASHGTSTGERKRRVGLFLRWVPEPPAEV